MFDAQKMYLFQDFFNTKMSIDDKLDIINNFLIKEFSLEFYLSREIKFLTNFYKEIDEQKTIIILMSDIETNITYKEEEFKFDQYSFIFINSKLLTKNHISSNVLFYYVCSNVREKN